MFIWLCCAIRLLFNICIASCFKLVNCPVQGLALAPDDAWSVHSVAHVYEMKAELEKGLKFMEGREKDWEVLLLWVFLSAFVIYHI